MGRPAGIHAHLIEGLVVSDNVIDGVDGSGIAVRDCGDVSVNGNVVRNADGPGIDPSGAVEHYRSSDRTGPARSS
ncbi:MAG: hypothetical protein ABEH88_01295 [Halobacteriales archaeon]